MTPLRLRQTLQAELAGLKSLLQSSQPDPWATPMMNGRIEMLEEEIQALSDKPPLAPTAELFFRDGPTLGSEGLEATFTAEVLESYQNMVTNHYAAKHYGTLLRSGRRRGEAETQLFLTGLPRGSFGLQLSQPYVENFVTATNVSEAMLKISQLVEATAQSDESFETALAEFDARVFKPLKRFIVALHTGGGDCRLVTGFHETPLSTEQITAAYSRVASADLDEKIIEMPGIFGGLLTNSWQFDFCPVGADWIRGSLSDEVSTDTASEWNLHYTSKSTIAKLKISTVITRAGNKKPGYELLDLKPLDEPPSAPTTPPPPSTPPASPGARPKRKFNFDEK